jgi:RNA polymerase sigma-70 factor (ECF subfamily)
VVDTDLIETISGVGMHPDAATERRFQELFGAYHQHVYAYCRRRADSGMARDAASETFLTAWRRIDSVPDGDRALRWLYGVARKVLANQYRSRKRYRRLVVKVGSLGADPQPDPATQVVRRLEDQEVLDALGRLRPEDQELLRLAVWEELPHGEIGEILGCTAHAVDQRIRRAGDRLASELQRSGHRHQQKTTPDSAPKGEAT